MVEQSKDDVLSVTTQTISEESGVTAEDIIHGTTFTQDFGVDPLGLLTIATQVEECFGMILDDSLIPALPTVGALADLMTSKEA